MSTEKIDNSNLSILKEIFYILKSQGEESIIPLLKSSDSIKEYKRFLSDKKISPLDKITTIKTLYNLFNQNKILIPFFVKKYNNINNNANFFLPLIDLYLNDLIEKEDRKFLEDLIILINSNVSLNKSTLEIIYQKLSKYYRNEGKIILNKQLLIRYLNLLKIFYKDNSLIEVTRISDLSGSENNSNTNSVDFTSTNNVGSINRTSCSNNSSNNASVSLERNSSLFEKEKEINNYIYFNGFGSNLSLRKNYCINSNMITNINTNYFTNFPSLENGLSFIFWINLNQNSIKNYYEIHNTKQNRICLINLIFLENKIMLLFLESRSLQIVIDDMESELIDISHIFQYDKWNFFSFIIEKNSFKIYVNNNKFIYNNSHNNNESNNFITLLK